MKIIEITIGELIFVVGMFLSFIAILMWVAIGQHKEMMRLYEDQVGWFKEHRRLCDIIYRRNVTDPLSYQPKNSAVRIQNDRLN